MAKATEKSLWDSFIPKAKMVGSFAKHIKDHEKERAELIKFVEKMVEDLKSDDDEETTNRYQFRVRKFSVKPTPKSRDVDFTVCYFWCFIPYKKLIFPIYIILYVYHNYI